ncbi:MATE family efflux transporter [Salinarchaeum chitinilyticum]
MVEEFSTTLMRTTDILISALFSPAALAALGIADLYAKLSTSVGNGLGTGMIALSSQDTGRGALADRDQAITQTLLLGFALGIPFVLVGLWTHDWLFAMLGSPQNVVELGGTYLAIIFGISPARHIAQIEERALQGTGNTRSPMAVAIVANLLNIGVSLALGLGLGPFPDLAIVGVGLGTALGTVFTASALFVIIWRYEPDLAFVRPQGYVICRQVVVISAPKIGESLLSTVAELPFNALLLSFGTNVNAAYQLGRLIGDTFSDPISIGFNVTASMVVGQELGSGRPKAARYFGWATAAMGAVTLGLFGAVVVLGAPWIVGLFNVDPTTARYAVGYTRAFGVAAPFLALYVVFAGALQGGGDTRVPFIARVSALFVFMLGASYVLSVPLGLGVPGTYVGIVCYYAWSFLVNVAGFHWGDWQARATEMMNERERSQQEPTG